MKQTFKLSLVALALVAGSAAQAQSAGTWMARVGATGIYPQVSSGDLSPPAWPNTQTVSGKEIRAATMPAAHKPL